MNTTAANPVSILARGVKGAAGSKRAGILADALCRNDGATLSVTATDLEVCAVASIAAPSDSPPAESVVSTATGEPVTDRSPADFPAVGTLDGEIVASLRTTFGTIRRIVDHITPATDSESSRYALGGILLDCEGDGGPAYAVGTDGRRMHIARFSGHATAGATAIVSPRLFSSFVATVKATGKVIGRKSLDSDEVRIAISTRGVEVAWFDDIDGAAARAVCRRMEGRFPDWRRVIGDDASSIPCVVDAGCLAPWCAEVTKATAAAAKAAGAAAVAALPDDQRHGAAVKAVRARAAARGRTEGSHPRGVRLDRDGATGRGCPMRTGGSFPWSVMLDSTFLGEALAAAAAWSETPRVTIHATNGQSVCRLPGGDWDSGRGAGFLAVVMPLAND
jgi:hypothetical protein